MSANPSPAPCPYSTGTPAPSPLSKREAEVAWWISFDLMDKEIADLLGIALRTINAHRDHILLKLHALDSAIRTRTGIAVWIVKKYHGLLSVMLAAWGEVGHLSELSLLFG